MHIAGEILATLEVVEPTLHPLSEEVFTIACRAEGEVQITGGANGDIGQARMTIYHLRPVSPGETKRGDAVLKAWPFEAARSNSASLYGTDFEVGDVIRVALNRDYDAPLKVTITKRELS